jgi:ribonuclease P protein component
MIARVDPTDVTRLAVALPRSVGSAVVRNRIRRRLRVVFRGLDELGQIPAGSYLVSFADSSGALKSSEMAELMGDLMARVSK